jgi:hypothetical protein
MKLAILIGLVLVLAAFVGAPSATAKRAPCSQKALAVALHPGSELYVMERCGRRFGLPFG